MCDFGILRRAGETESGADIVAGRGIVRNFDQSACDVVDFRSVGNLADADGERRRMSGLELYSVKQSEVRGQRHRTAAFFIQ